MRVRLFISDGVVLSVHRSPLPGFHTSGQPQEESQKERYARIETNCFVRKGAMEIRRGGQGRNLGYGEANE